MHRRDFLPSIAALIASPFAFLREKPEPEPVVIAPADDCHMKDCWIANNDAPEVHVYVDPFNPRDPTVQELVHRAMSDDLRRTMDRQITGE